MSVMAANTLNIKVIVLDKVPNPATQVSSLPVHINQDFQSKEGILDLAAVCNVLTVEIEHVNVDALDLAAAKYPNLEIHPNPSTIRLIQDKYLQKADLKSRGIPVSSFCSVENTIEAISAVGEEYGYYSHVNFSL